MVGDKMVRSFIRVRSLIQLSEPLTSGFWVPREEKEPTWVTVRYERLENFCYKCGRIGHEAHGCKDSNGKEEEDEPTSEFGKWLSVPPIKTIEDVLVIHKKNWVEAQCSTKRQPPYSSHRNKASGGFLPNYGNQNDGRDMRKIDDESGNKVIDNIPGTNNNDNGPMKSDSMPIIVIATKSLSIPKIHEPPRAKDTQTL